MLVTEGLNPPHGNHKGAPHLNVFLVFVLSVVVPAGFTRHNLPAGIVFLGVYTMVAMLSSSLTPMSKRSAIDATGCTIPNFNHCF
jgi:hypothetical protein